MIEEWNFKYKRLETQNKILKSSIIGFAIFTLGLYVADKQYTKAQLKSIKNEIESIENIKYSYKPIENQSSEIDISDKKDNKPKYVKIGEIAEEDKFKIVVNSIDSKIEKDNKEIVTTNITLENISEEDQHISSSKFKIVEGEGVDTEELIGTNLDVNRIVKVGRKVTVEYSSKVSQNSELELEFGRTVIKLR